MADRTLNIAITKSRLKSFSIQVSDSGEVEFACNLALCTEAGIEVTTVQHSTVSWQGKPMKVPEDAYAIAGKLAGILHAATEEHVKNLQLLLESPSF